jgi:hypothetical protein
MNAMPNPAQPEFYAGVLPVEPPVEAPAICPADMKNGRLLNRQPSFRKRTWRAVSRFLITFCIGAAATVAWQSHGDAVRDIIASLYPPLAWLAPQGEPAAQDALDMIGPAASAAHSLDQQKQLNVVPIDLETVRQGIDRMAPSIVAGQEQMARSIDRIAATQEQIARSVDQLTAGQEQVKRDIAKLQAVEQYILYKNSEPPPRPAPTQARTPVLRPSRAPIAR